MEEKQIYSILIAGTSIAREGLASSLADRYHGEGFIVFVVRDAARTLLLGGVNPGDFDSEEVYTKLCLKLQNDQYELFSEAARSAAADKVLILYDGGETEIVPHLDGRMPDWNKLWEARLRETGLNPAKVFDHYDGVLYVETPPEVEPGLEEEIVELDNARLAAWTGHPHLRVISRSLSAKQLMPRLLEETDAILGIPEPYEIERKYLIEYPDLARLRRLPQCRKVKISQTYLTLEDGEKIRIRKRGFDGHFTYVETRKRSITGAKRLETERSISKEEYDRLLAQAGPCPAAISKDRYCFLYENQYFELDIYPFWKDRAILEIELLSEDSVPSLPPQIRVISDVTEDPAYTNAALAASLCRGSNP